MNNNQQKLLDWIVTTLREAAWAPIGVIIFYVIGLIFDWFNLVPTLDIPTHFAGGLAITYFYRSAIRNSQKFLGDIPQAIQIILAFTATGTTTVFWEFYEILSDFIIRTHHVRGIKDTITDLFIGLCGALALSIFYRKR